MTWHDQCLQVVIACAKSGRGFTTCEVRTACTQRGIADPAHPNQWGALLAAAAKQGTIAPTGRHVRSSIASRNSAYVREWIGSQWVKQPEPEITGAVHCWRCCPVPRQKPCSCPCHKQPMVVK